MPRPSTHAPPTPPTPPTPSIAEQSASGRAGGREASPFSSVDEVLADLRAGKMAVVTDDENRENEGDLILPAEFITPEAVVFMLREATGYMFVSLTEADCDRLNLHWQTPVNTSVRGTPLTVSVDGHPKHGFTTGVSAFERAATIAKLIDPATGPDDFVRPGHINPLRSRDGGVLVRTGHTEAIVDLCRLAGLTPACVGIEIMREDGRMARVPDLERFCARHGIRMVSIAQIIEHRLGRESLVRRIEPAAGTPIVTPHGTFNLIAFESVVDPLPHLALTLGGVGELDAAGRVIERDEPTLVRVQRRHLLGDIFFDDASGGAGGAGGTEGGGAGATGELLHGSLAAIAAAGAGALVYLRPEGVGDGLEQRLQRIKRGGGAGTVTPSDSLSPDAREYGIGSQILRALGLTRLKLLSNTPAVGEKGGGAAGGAGGQYPLLESFGLRIEQRRSIPPWTFGAFRPR